MPQIAHAGVFISFWAAPGITSCIFALPGKLASVHKIVIPARWRLHGRHPADPAAASHPPRHAPAQPEHRPPIEEPASFQRRALFFPAPTPRAGSARLPLKTIFSTSGAFHELSRDAGAEPQSTGVCPKNQGLLAWVADMAALCKPTAWYWCDGSQEEYDRLCQQLVDAGTFRKLNPVKRPNSSWPAPTRATWPASKTAPTSALRRRKTPARPTTGWPRPKCAPPCSRCSTAACSTAACAPCTWCRSPWARWAADRPHRHRAVRQRLCGRQHEDHDAHGPRRVRRAGRDGEFVPCVHTVGARWPARPTWPGPATRPKYIVHYPETREIWSYGSGYGGNALLGKKCFALRIASTMGRDQGWLAEHMLILGVTSPEGKKYHVAAAPSPAPAARPTSPC